MSLVALFFPLVLGWTDVPRFDTSGQNLLFNGRVFRAWDGMKFGGGDLSAGYGQPPVWTVGGKVEGRIDVHSLLEDWLQDDSIWGGHERANELRWMEEGKGGGINVVITDVTETPDGDALAVMNLMSGAYSFAAPLAQILVKLHRKPFSMERVRFLGGTGNGDASGIPRRLYPFQGKIFCVEGSKISWIDGVGRTVGTLCAWTPTSVPIGVSGHRWLIGATGGYEDRGLTLTDLSTGKTKPLVDLDHEVMPPGFGGLEATRDTSPTILDLEEPYVLFSFGSGTEGNARVSKYVSIHLPDGRRQELPGFYYSVQLVGPYVVDRHYAANGGTIRLVLAKSGKVVGRWAEKG